MKSFDAVCHEKNQKPPGRKLRPGGAEQIGKNYLDAIAACAAASRAIGTRKGEQLT